MQYKYLQQKLYSPKEITVEIFVYKRLSPAPRSVLPPWYKGSFPIWRIAPRKSLFYSRRQYRWIFRILPMQDININKIIDFLRREKSCLQARENHCTMNCKECFLYTDAPARISLYEDIIKVLSNIPDWCRKCWSQIKGVYLWNIQRIRTL